MAVVVISLTRCHAAGMSPVGTCIEVLLSRYAHGRFRYVVGEIPEFIRSIVRMPQTQWASWDVDGRSYVAGDVRW